jgi:alpha-tubulin suppressor-like RCC1 family protein
VRIDAGGDKACGTEAGGAIRCWGSEMLGDGSVDRDSVPRLVGGGLALQSLAIGERIACGLTADGVAYCWGPNDYGQLGIGSQSAMELLPRAVAGGAMKFKRVSPGGHHVCGIALDDRVYCWGNNTLSQLGRDSAPEVCFPGNPPQCAFLPVPVADTQTYMTIAAGAYHTCGLTFTGQAFCWGSAEEGALGTAFAVAPTPEAVVTNLRFTMLVSGVDTNCGLIASGAAYCWGSNGYGQLGTDNPTYTCPARPHPLCSPFPEPVTGGLAFRSLSAQFGHTCGLSVAGLAYCWGNGWWGQLGDGNPYDHISYVPVRVIEQSDPPP